MLEMTFFNFFFLKLKGGNRSDSRPRFSLGLLTAYSMCAWLRVPVSHCGLVDRNLFGVTS